MGRMIIKSTDSDVLGTAELNITHPQIIEGYWWNEKVISKAYLGQTVTFKVKTNNMDSNWLSFTLYDNESDTSYDSIYERSQVSNNQAIIKLELKEYWQFEMYKKGRPLKLYWDVSDIKGIYDNKKLPLKKEYYLTVMPRLLYVSPQESNNNPCIFNENGVDLFIYELTQNLSSGLDELSDIDIKNYKYIITNSSAKGIGKIIKGAIDYGGSFVDIVNVVRSGGANVKDLPLPLVGQLAPLVIIADIEVSRLCAFLKDASDYIDLVAIKQLKYKGLRRISKYVSDYDPGNERFEFLNVSPRVAIDIIHGKYYAINEINQNTSEEKSVTLFLRIIEIGSIKINIVESFYFPKI